RYSVVSRRPRNHRQGDVMHSNRPVLLRARRHRQAFKAPSYKAIATGSARCSSHSLFNWTSPSFSPVNRLLTTECRRSDTSPDLFGRGAGWSNSRVAASETSAGSNPNARAASRNHSARCTRSGPAIWKVPAHRFVIRTLTAEHRSLTVVGLPNWSLATRTGSPLASLGRSAIRKFLDSGSNPYTFVVRTIR